MFRLPFSMSWGELKRVFLMSLYLSWLVNLALSSLSVVVVGSSAMHLKVITP